jgi:hypothetical protein
MVHEEVRLQRIRTQCVQVDTDTGNGPNKLHVDRQLIPVPVPIPTPVIKKQFIITLIIVRVNYHAFCHHYL